MLFTNSGIPQSLRCQLERSPASAVYAKLVSDVAHTIKTERKLYTTAGNGKRAFTDTRDVGESSSHVFQNPGNTILSRDLWNVRVLRKWIGLLEIRRNKQGKMLKKNPLTFFHFLTHTTTYEGAFSTIPGSQN